MRELTEGEITAISGGTNECYGPCNPQPSGAGQPTGEDETQETIIIEDSLKF